MKFFGVITHINERSGVTKNGDPFVSYQIRIEERTVSYPQSMLLDCFGDKYKDLKVREYVEVDFNMSCEVFDGKLYGKNRPFKVTVLAAPEPVNNAPLIKGVDVDNDPLSKINKGQMSASNPQSETAGNPNAAVESFEQQGNLPKLDPIGSAVSGNINSTVNPTGEENVKEDLPY